MKTMYLISSISYDVDQITVLEEDENSFVHKTEIGNIYCAKNGVEGYQIFDTEKEAWQAIAERLREKRYRLLMRVHEVQFKFSEIEQRIKSLEP